jgi:hypothetical protein
MGQRIVCLAVAAGSGHTGTGAYLLFFSVCRGSSVRRFSLFFYIIIIVDCLVGKD